MSEVQTPVFTGRCYCGAITLRAMAPPQTVSYCHCSDCRRATGAPVAAFVAMEEGTVEFLPNAGREVSVSAGVIRTFCGECGSSLMGRYNYLPGQIFLSLGVIDQADALVPELHSHAAERLSWLHISDDLERVATSARRVIVEKST